MSDQAEHTARFECLGSWCSGLVIGKDGQRSAREALGDARHSLEAWHEAFSRFRSDSELSLLNEDPRREVPVSALMARLAAAVRTAGELSSGRVDATLVRQLEQAGYATDLGRPLALEVALSLAPERRPARASTAARWREVHVDRQANTVTRPPGVRIDSGGLAKGLFADVLAERLARHAGFAVDCAGDIALGGRQRLLRPVHVEGPFDTRTLLTFPLRGGCVATSGIARRSWLDRQGRPSHHLLDAASGRPAFTGVVQATALAPSAVEAEICAKAALLAGPRAAGSYLPHGGLIVHEDGSHRLIAAPPVLDASALARFARGPGRGGERRSGEDIPESAAA